MKEAEGILRDIREGASPGREEHPDTWRRRGRVCVEARGLTEHCICVPQELDNQYSPSRWVVRLGAEEAMRTYSQIGSEGTGGPLCGRFGWTLACGSGSRCWGREEEPHSPASLDGSQSPGISSAPGALAAGPPRGGSLRDCAAHPCLISQPASYAQALRLQWPRGVEGKKEGVPSAAESGMLLLFTKSKKLFFFFFK